MLEKVEVKMLAKFDYYDNTFSVTPFLKES